eukprot:GFUD01022659.1.p1 GENE.GFUD01022659.1~~GFUD01022659.1.p1  ORF type:complete len:223 (-),score=82.20 GFUD01022659.1:247-873(-)
MATATPSTTCASSCPTKDATPYDRIIIDLEDRPDIKKEVEDAMDLLDYVMCRVPDQEDPKYKDDEDSYEDDLEEMQTKTDAIKPKDFPYTFYLMDVKQEKAFDEAIFSSYKGPVYWNDCGRDFIVDPNQPKENFQPENMANLVYSSLTPLKIYEGGEKPLTSRIMCEGVAKAGFIPGEHCFLENIQIQMREINGEEAMTVVFYAGPEQ